jgi:predicted amidophosphoribosyltransferase
MAFPIKVCVVCQEEFELKPNKPGFANRCPSCSEPEETGPASTAPQSTEERLAEAEANEARRKAIRDLLYRGDS